MIESKKTTIFLLKNIFFKSLTTIVYEQNIRNIGSDYFSFLPGLLCTVSFSRDKRLKYECLNIWYLNTWYFEYQAFLNNSYFENIWYFEY